MINLLKLARYVGDVAFLIAEYYAISEGIRIQGRIKFGTWKERGMLFV